jgi:hypothetical protein
LYAARKKAFRRLAALKHPKIETAQAKASESRAPIVWTRDFGSGFQQF